MVEIVRSLDYLYEMVQSLYQLSDSLTASEVEELRSARRKRLDGLLTRASELFRSSVMDEFEARGFEPLNTSHLRVLMSLDLAGNRSSELAERMVLSKQFISSLTREMARRSIVEFQPDPTDGRAKLVIPTELGLNLILTSTRIATDITKRYTEKIGRRRMTQLHAALKLLIESFEDDLIDPGASASP